jgi:hypothetical protein
MLRCKARTKSGGNNVAPGAEEQRDDEASNSQNPFSHDLSAAKMPKPKYA